MSKPETHQFAAFRGLIRYTLFCAAAAVGLFIGAALSSGKDRGPLIGVGILAAFLTITLSIPTWNAWKKRHTDEPWGVDGP